jgi:4-oxalomesaconate hydratase
VLVIGAHSVDFVWRAGGAVAVNTAAGGEARVIALSFAAARQAGGLSYDLDGLRALVEP